MQAYSAWDCISCQVLKITLIFFIKIDSYNCLFGSFLWKGVCVSNDFAWQRAPELNQFFPYNVEVQRVVVLFMSISLILLNFVSPPFKTENEKGACCLFLLVIDTFKEKFCLEKCYKRVFCSLFICLFLFTVMKERAEVKK